MSAKRFLLKMPLLLLAVGLSAQPGPVSGPVSGLVYDGGNRAVRPILGVPGAAYLGDAVISQADFARVSPDASAAVVLSDGVITLYRGLGTGKMASWKLEDFGQIDAAAWNADSSVVVLYDAATGRLRVWSGFPEPGETKAPDAGSPRNQRSATQRGMPLPSVIELGRIPASDGELTALAAVSADAALAGITGQAGGVYLYSRSSAPARTVDTPTPSALALSPDGLDLFVADRSRGQILIVPGYRESNGAILLADSTIGIGEPVALAQSGRSNNLWVANVSGPRLIALNPSSRAIEADVPLTFVPSRLQRLGDSETYLLNGDSPDAGPIRLLKAGADPMVYFVPARKLAEVR